MNNLITLCKKHIMKLILVLLLLGIAINIFTMGQVYAAGMFCLLFVTTVNVVYGKKYAIPFAVLGVVWLVISVYMEMT